MHGSYKKAFVVMDMSSLLFRRAQIKDLKLTFGWANDPESRAMSFNTSMIPFEDHSRWFQKRVDTQGEKQELLIAILGEKPVGQIRFDLEGDVAEISYMIDKEYRGQGFGKKIISEGIMACSLRPEGYIAQVKKENVASCRIFESCGFEKVEEGSIIKYFKADNR